MQAEEERQEREKNAREQSQMREQITRTELQTAVVTEENLKLQIQLEKERLARLRIEEKIAWRTITETEHKIIVTALSPYRGHTVIIDIQGDAEAKEYAHQLIGSLNDSGWTVQQNYSGITSPPPYGVICKTHSKPDHAVASLISTLMQAGVKLAVEHVNAQQTGFLEIVVGLRPPV